MATTPAREPNRLTPFFLLTFLISWVIFWIPAALTGQQLLEFPTALLFVLGGFGPLLAAVILVHRSADRQARRDFWRRLVNVKAIRPAWYALIVLIFPVLTGLGMALTALLGGEQPGMMQWNAIVEQPAGLIGILLMAFLFGAFSEEPGWRGYAQDRMVARWGFLKAVLLLGLVWWAWHLPLFFIPGTTHHTWGLGTGFFWLFLLNVFPLSVLIGLAYQSNQRSTLAALLLHMMYNFTLSIFFPIPLQLQLIITILLYLATALVWWLVKRQHQALPA